MTHPAQGAESVLARKLATPSGSDSDSDRSTLRALRIALARAAREELSLPLSVIGARQARQGQGDLADGLDGRWLPILLDGPDNGIGALCLDPGLVTALIQHQTMGKILSGTVTERRFTATDAAMMAPLIDAMLTRLEDLAEPPADRARLSGYRFGARVGAPGELLLSLTEEWYQAFHLTVEVDGGAVQGQMLILLPERSSPGTDDPDQLSHPNGPALDTASDVVRAELTAVLCRLRLSLADLSAMRPGDQIPLPMDRFDQTELVTINGDPVAIGRLGQLAGKRAVRVNEAAVPAGAQSLTSDEFDASVVPTDRGIPPPGLSAGTASDAVDSGAKKPTTPDLLPESLPESLPVPAATPTGVSGDRTEDVDHAGGDLAAEITRLAGLAGSEMSSPGGHDDG